MFSDESPLLSTKGKRKSLCVIYDQIHRRHHHQVWTPTHHSFALCFTFLRWIFSVFDDRENIHLSEYGDKLSSRYDALILYFKFNNISNMEHKSSKLWWLTFISLLSHLKLLSLLFYKFKGLFFSWEPLDAWLIFFFSKITDFYRLH